MAWYKKRQNKRHVIQKERYNRTNPYRNRSYMYPSLRFYEGCECLTMVLYLLFSYTSWISSLFAMDISEEFQRIYSYTYSPILKSASTL